MKVGTVHYKLIGYMFQIGMGSHMRWLIIIISIVQEQIDTIPHEDTS